jgi:iron(III) transport system ATP-binding protein
MTGTALELRDLQRHYGGVRAVDGVSLEVPPGAVLVLLGPSGCGKTTIMRMLAGLEAPTGGEILFNGAVVASGSGIAVPPGKRNVGLVFQSYALWPHMTVAGNVEWPLKVAGWSADKRKERVAQVLNLLSMNELQGRYPSELSGGQQQRVAIARTLAPSPGVILFDEPLSNLDAKLRVEMRAELLRIHRASGATSVYVTHDQVEAMTMATHVAVMKNGRLEQFGSPRALLESPRTPFVATFVGTPPANLLTAHSRNGKIFVGDVEVTRSPAGLNGACWAMYRPEQLKVHLESAPRRLELDFAESTPLAGAEMVTGWFGTERVTAVVQNYLPLGMGERFYLELPPEPSALFDASGSRVALPALEGAR